MTPDEKSQVAHLCAYITDDGMIAAHVGVDRSHVVELRRNVVKAAPRRFLPTRHESAAAGSGVESQAHARTEAKDGSERLLRAMEREFDRLSRDRRVTFDDARLLLMNAVM